MTTDWRALCAELLSEFDYYSDWSDAEEVKERARASLAEPEPEGPTDEQLCVAYKQGHEARWQEGFPSSWSLIDMERAAKTAGLRAVLARWGTPNSERLPGPGDCDAEWRCWLGG